MYCSKCGKKLTPKMKLCTGCGTHVPTIGETTSEEHVNESLIGFSSKINDASFEKYRRESKSWSYIFSFILATVTIIAFPIYGRHSGELDWPYSLYYGFGIGGMFVTIAFLQSFKRNHDNTWDGVVLDKKVFRRHNLNDNDSNRSYIEYVLTVKGDNGKKHKHKWRNSPELYNYYNLGDKIRHHKGFMYYEKYDKSQDKQIMCAACMSFNDITDEFCSRCKRPLLK